MMITGNVASPFLSKKEIKYVAFNIGSRWNVLGRQLGCSLSELGELEEMKTPHVTIAFIVIENWTRREKENATKQTMIEILIYMNETDMANHLQQNNKKDEIHRPTDHQISYVASCVGMEWKQIGRYLGFDDDNLDRIEYDQHHSLYAMVYSMLNLWRHTATTESSIDKLCEALNKNMKQHIAEKLQSPSRSRPFQTSV